MRHATLLLSLVCLLVACESDEIMNTNGAGNTTEKKLILNPTHLEGEQYAQCTLRAKVTNVPSEEVFFFWDLDDGNGFNKMSWIVYPRFDQIKVHNVRVKAIDGFTDVLLGYDSIRVDIRPPRPFIELNADVVDTTFEMTETGAVKSPVTFSLECSSPFDKIDLVWNFDDGSEEFTDTASEAQFGYFFKRVGTMNVRVSAYEKTGLYIGSDTIKVTLRFPSFTLEDITSRPIMAAFLDVGTGHPLNADPLFTNPLGAWLQDYAGGEILTKMVVKGNTVHCMYDRYYVDTNSGTLVLHDTMTAVISEDLTRLRTVRVAVHDTGDLVVGTPSNNGGLHYTYALKDLQLLAVTQFMVVYRSVPDDLDAFLTDISFRASNQINHTAGYYTGIGNPTLTMRKPGVFAVVIFARQQ